MTEGFLRAFSNYNKDIIINEEKKRWYILSWV